MTIQDTRIFTAWIDGACEPINPGGTASYGILVLEGDYVRNPSQPYNELSEMLRESKVIGRGPTMSNNVAEYAAVIALLLWYKTRLCTTEEREIKAPPNFTETKKILKLTGPELNVLSDSQLVVNQLQGNWQMKGGLYSPYYQQAMLALRELSPHQIDFRWIPREQNRADSLSHEAIKTARLA